MEFLRKVSLYFLLLGQIFVLSLHGQEPKKKQEKEKFLIQIGENRQVSMALPHVPHYGVMLATNPLDPKNLLGGSVIFPAEYAHPSVAVYVSFDEGRSWGKSSVLSDLIKKEAENPVLAFDSEGKAYFSFLHKDESYEKRCPYNISLFRSDDNGKTWSEVLKARKDIFFDWHNLLVDQSGGKFNHRLYLMGTEIVEKTDKVNKKKLSIYYSEDKGSTFKGPLNEIDDIDSFNGGILQDGTLVILYIKSFYSPYKKDPSDSYHKLLVVTSHNEGKSFSSPAVVADVYQAKKSIISNAPSLAVDNSPGPFRNRLYVTWLDARRGCYDVYLSWSSDKGRSWSTPIIINDNPSPANLLEGPDHTCPGVAVNKDGVVGVIWYDRRDDGLNKESMLTGVTFATKSIVEHDNRWQIYFTASLDGGDCFLPNVKVSTALFSNNAPGNWVPMTKGGDLCFYLPQNIYPGAGKAGCFATSSDGRFHAFWVDSRTGVSQIWTAPIEVEGKAFPGGSEEDARLEDVSHWVKFEVTNTNFVPRDRVIELDVQLRNISEDKTLVGPLKVRLLGTNSGYGTWEVLEADNKLKGNGAIWDFTSLLPNGKLKPREISNKKHLILKLKDEVPANALRFRHFLEMRTKVLGKRES
jgi:hypothetical protein